MTIVERAWQEMFLETLNQPRFAFFGVRYMWTTDSSLPPRKQSCILGFSRCVTWIFTVFYGHPVELEVVGDDLLLVFSVDVLQRTVQYRQPDLRQIRDCVSLNLSVSE